MKNIILFDDESWKALLPLSYTRPVSELRIGTKTIREKWEFAFAAKASHITEDHLSEKYPINIQKENILINGSILPTRSLELLIRDLEINEALLFNDQLIAARLNDKQIFKMVEDKEVESIRGLDITHNPELINKINSPTDIFTKTGQEILKDFAQITAGRKSMEISDSNTLIGAESQLFLEPGVTMEACILNTKTGPIYIGKNALIMEGSMLRGPLSIGDDTVIKMGAKIYNNTSIGPGCKVGGEVQNISMLANSNKAHDGYLGNSVIGEWCNLGAGTSASNLKNNYDEVKIWSYPTERFEKTGLQFCGLIMGDYSKCGINTMFNTGTVVGVSANVYGEGFPRNFIPSFAWGGRAGYQTYGLTKAFETHERVMERRGTTLTEADKKILGQIFKLSSPHRSWEE